MATGNGGRGQSRPRPLGPCGHEWVSYMHGCYYYEGAHRCAREQGHMGEHLCMCGHKHTCAPCAEGITPGCAHCESHISPRQALGAFLRGGAAP